MVRAEAAGNKQLAIGQNKQPVVFRMYAGADFVKIAEKLVEMGEPLPNPLLSIGWTAETEDGTIVALGVLQSLPFIEPFHAEPGYGDCLKTLFEQMQDFILDSGARRVMMHTDHRAMKLMLENVDAKAVDSTFYDWRRPEPPIPPGPNGLKMDVVDEVEV